MSTPRVKESRESFLTEVLLELDLGGSVCCYKILDFHRLNGPQRHSVLHIMWIRKLRLREKSLMVSKEKVGIRTKIS